MIGSARSQPRFSGSAAGLIVWGLIFVCAMASSSRGEDADLRHYSVIGDAIPVSLTGSSGDPTRGRTIVVNRESTCLLCHSGPFPEEKFQGNLGPDLAGTGSRWSEGQLRLRVVDAAVLNPVTIMPPFHRVEGLTQVDRAWRGKPILSAEQIEDVVAFLTTLRN